MNVIITSPRPRAVRLLYFLHLSNISWLWRLAHKHIRRKVTKYEEETRTVTVNIPFPPGSAMVGEYSVRINGEKGNSQ